MRRGNFRGFNDFLDSCVGLAVGDIFCDGSIEQEDILEHEAVERAVGLDGKGINGLLIKLDRSRLRFVESDKQVGDGRLARS